MEKSALKKDFEHKQYGFCEDASIQVCEWNKKALRSHGKEHCYKQDFYGADTLSCHQITPVTFWCNNSCIFCWRPKEYLSTRPSKEADALDPQKMIDGLIAARKKLLSGFGGHDAQTQKLLGSALEQRHWAVSLSGEPTLYKRLPELISLLKKRKGTETVFLVSNGQNPKMLVKLWARNALPTQLYLSMIAPEEKLWKSITCNSEARGWKKYLKSLALLKLLPCRTVIRLTVIKGLNDSDASLEGFAELLEVILPDFIEVKSYMWLGYSRQRLREENTPSHEYTKGFAERLLAQMPSFKFEAEKETSRIILLKRKNSKFKTKIINRK